MTAQDYSICLPEPSETDSTMIFNIKLTEELVEKLMKGQEDLDNLKGIEFCISEQSNVKETYHKTSFIISFAF